MLHYDSIVKAVLCIKQALMNCLQFVIQIHSTQPVRFSKFFTHTKKKVNLTNISGGFCFKDDFHRMIILFFTVLEQIEITYFRYIVRTLSANHRNRSTSSPPLFYRNNQLETNAVREKIRNQLMILSNTINIAHLHMACKL